MLYAIYQTTACSPAVHQHLVHLLIFSSLYTRARVTYNLYWLLVLIQNCLIGLHLFDRNNFIRDDNISKFYYENNNFSKIIREDGINTDCVRSRIGVHLHESVVSQENSATCEMWSDGAATLGRAECFVTSSWEGWLITCIKKTFVNCHRK